MHSFVQGRSLRLEMTILTLPSVTYAIKAKKALSHQGIRSELIKVDTSKSKNGCTYGLRIASERFYDAIAELRRRNYEYAVYPQK